MIADRHIGLLDKFAVSSSTICAVHCVALPFLVGVFPAIGATIFGDEAFHVMLLRIAIPLSVFGLTLGCRKHRDLSVMGVGFAGVGVLVLAALFGHDILGGNGERMATLLGATLIAIAHIRNYMLCQSDDCTHECSHD